MHIFINAVSGYNFNVIYLKLILLPFLFICTLFKKLTAISKAAAFAIVLIVAAVISIVIMYFIELSKGEVTYLNGEEVYTKSLPNPASLLWPAHKSAKWIIAELVERIPVFMPFYGAYATAPVILNEI